MKKSAKRAMNHGATMAVFLFVLARLFGFYMQDPSNPAIFESYGDYYISHWFIIESNIVALILSAVLVERVLRFKACIYTRAATITCAFISLLDLFQSIFLIDYGVYHSIFSHVMWSGCGLLVLICILMPLFKRL